MRNCEPTPRGTERGGVGNPPLQVRAPHFYPTVAADKAIVDERRSVLRMSQYELRRRGNARPGGADTALEEVTPPTGKGALGKRRVSSRTIILMGATNGTAPEV